MLLSVDSTHTVYLKGKNKKKWDDYWKNGGMTNEEKLLRKVGGNKEFQDKD